MAFSEQIQQLCSEVSAEQAVSLGEFIVDLPEQIETNPFVLNTRLQSLMKEVTDEGYECDGLLHTLQQLAKGVVSGSHYHEFSSDWASSFENDITLADFISLQCRKYADLKGAYLELLQVAQDERKALADMAGGTSAAKALSSPWRRNSKQNKTIRAIEGAAEVAVGVALGVGAVKLGQAAYNYGDDKQLWGTINKRIGGEGAPTFREWTGSRFYSDHHPDADPDRLRIQLSIGKNDAKQTLGELVAARNKLADAGTLTAEQEAILFDNAYKTLCAHGRNNDLREEVVTSLHPDSVIIEKVTFLAEHRKVFVLPQTLQKPLQDVDEALKWKNIDIERLDNFKLSGKYRSRTGDAARDCIPNETEVAIDFVTSERLALGMKWDNKDAVTGELDQNQAFRNLIREVNQTEIKLMIYNDANRNGLSLHEVIDYYTSIDQKTKKSCLIQDDEHEVHLLFDNAANQGLDYEGNPLSDNDVKLNEASRLLPRQLGFSSEPSSIFKECHDKKLAEYNEDRMKRKISVAQVDHDLKDIKASDVDYRREEMIVRRDLSNSVGPYRESSFIDPARTDDSSHELPGMMSSHPDEPYRSFAGVDQALESEGVQASEAVVKGAEKDTERVVGDEVSSELDAADATRKEIRATDEALSDI